MTQPTLPRGLSRAALMAAAALLALSVPCRPRPSAARCSAR